MEEVGTMKAALKQKSGTPQKSGAQVVVLLWLPKQLHQEALSRAERMGMSLQEWIIQAIISQLSLR